MKEISLWGKIVGAIKRLFGFEAFAPEGCEVTNALAEAERLLVKMLNNFDKSTYDAIKDKLQRSGIELWNLSQEEVDSLWNKSKKR